MSKKTYKIHKTGSDVCVGFLEMEALSQTWKGTGDTVSAGRRRQACLAERRAQFWVCQELRLKKVGVTLWRALYQSKEVSLFLVGIGVLLKYLDGEKCLLLDEDDFNWNYNYRESRTETICTL